MARPSEPYFAAKNSAPASVPLASVTVRRGSFFSRLTTRLRKQTLTLVVTGRERVDGFLPMLPRACQLVELLFARGEVHGRACARVQPLAFGEARARVARVGVFDCRGGPDEERLEVWIAARARQMRASANMEQHTAKQLIFCIETLLTTIERICRRW